VADLQIESWKTRHGDVIMTLNGEVTVNNFEQLDEELHDAIDAGVSRLLVNLSGLTYITSTGIGALVGAHHELSEAGGRLVIVRPPAEVMRMLESMKLNRVLILADSLNEGQAMLRQGA
jgi:anti-anti-sigma factor